MSLLETAIGTAAGSLVGIFGVFLGYWIQRRSREEAELDSAIQFLLEELARFLNSHLEVEGKNFWSVRRPSPPTSHYAVTTAVSMVHFRARGKNLSAGFLISEIWHEGLETLDTFPISDLVLELHVAITTWRARNRRERKRPTDNSPLQELFMKVLEHLPTDYPELE